MRLWDTLSKDRQASTHLVSYIGQDYIVFELKLGFILHRTRFTVFELKLGFIVIFNQENSISYLNFHVFGVFATYLYTSVCSSSRVPICISTIHRTKGMDADNKEPVLSAQHTEASET